jgi:AcrR family transcriptional regulator
MSFPPARSGSRPRSRSAAGLPPITADRIIDEAMLLTVEHGLENWTVRQLAAAVDAYPAVIYHHVGDRDAVVKEVCERVVGMLPVPDTELSWRDWFAQLLTGMRDVMREYPGCARRILLYELSVSAAAVLIEHGVGALLAAGFGDESVLVYNVLMSTACQHVAMEDDRDNHTPARFGNAETYLAYRGQAEAPPGLAKMGDVVFEMMRNPELTAGYCGLLYEYAIARCLDGIASRLEELRGQRYDSNSA